jgi:universal stress protein E
VHAYIPLSIAASAANVAAPLANTLSPEALQYEDNEKRKELRTLTDKYGIPEPNVHLELGVATDVLPEKAEDLNADLVVMGAIARSGLERIFIGSTAEGVLEKLPCDVLMLKPVNFRDALPG